MCMTIHVSIRSAVDCLGLFVRDRVSACLITAVCSFEFAFVCSFV